MGIRWTWVAWSMLAVFVVGYGLGVLLSVVNGNLTLDSASFTLAFAAFMTMGSRIGPATPSAGSSPPSACWQRPAWWPWSMPRTPA